MAAQGGNDGVGGAAAAAIAGTCCVVRRGQRIERNKETMMKNVTTIISLPAGSLPLGFVLRAHAATAHTLNRVVNASRWTWDLFFFFVSMV